MQKLYALPRGVPLLGLALINLQLRGDDLVLLPLRGGQHNPATLRHLQWGAMGGNPPLEFGLIGWT